MEAPEMGDVNKSEAHLTSAAAFVEGGIQDACDDACSICLEAFCLSDPSTVTGCKHEFHLQCILEWCQRSSQCPMCWQPISLKDPTSQELLEAVETERNLRLNPARNATIFHHPTLGDFELQHLPVGASDAELEERIIQHLAAAAAMGRARHIARREGQRNRGSSGQGRPQFLVFSTHPNSPAASPASSSPVAHQSGLSGEPVPPFTLSFPSPSNSGEESPQPPRNSFTSPTQVVPESASTSGSRSVVVGPQTVPHLSNRSSTSQTSPSTTQDVPGPSDLQSFSESLKSRFNAVSMRYKESISKSTRGWKERWFARNTSMADLGSEVKREVNAGIATVSRMMERLDTRDTNNNSNNNNNNINNINNSNNNNNNDNRTSDASVSSAVDSSIPGSDDRMESRPGNGNSFSETNVKASSCTASSSSD